MGKEEIARNEQFLLFIQCFLLNQKIVSPFVIIFDIISLFAAELEEPKIGMCGKGLNSSCSLKPFSVTIYALIFVKFVSKTLTDDITALVSKIALNEILSVVNVTLLGKNN